MKPLSRQPSSRWLNGATAVLATFAASDRLRAIPLTGASASPAAIPDAHGRFGFSYDRVLGTSLDVRLNAPPRETFAKVSGRCSPKSTASKKF